MGLTIMRRRMTRREALGAASLCAAGIVLAPRAVAAETGSDGLTDQGVGMYTDPSVAMQLSSFSINRTMVSCGVGTLGGPSFTGPFAMLMYALEIKEYDLDHTAHTIRCAGRMRSITKVAGNTVEDVHHDFLALAAANDGASGRFDVHMATPFWNPNNPMGTPSKVAKGRVRFGGELLMGEIVV